MHHIRCRDFKLRRKVDDMCALLGFYVTYGTTTVRCAKSQKSVSHARGLFPTVAPCTRFSSRRNRAHNGIYSETDSVQDRDKKRKLITCKRELQYPNIHYPNWFFPCFFLSPSRQMPKQKAKHTDHYSLTSYYLTLYGLRWASLNKLPTLVNNVFITL